MHAREEIRNAILTRKMKYWLMVARHPFTGKGCPAWRARKNYWRLIAKHKELAISLGLSAISVYAP
jgi:hypothetical protein